MTSMRNRNAVILLTFVVVTASLHVCDGWRSQSRPKIFGKRLQFQMLNAERPQIQRKIIMYHNMFRSQVRPPAKDMLSMTWHQKAAEAAKRWAEECQFLTHDNATGRFLPAFGSCGQNIFISTHHVPWFFAIKMWFEEKDFFEYNSTLNNLTDVGHYTQLVWASTHKVGCGIAECGNARPDNRTYFSYVCNYCPIGNDPVDLGRPYAAGPWCSSCQQACKSRRLCLNACPVADRWTNCLHLYRSWPHWLCKSQSRSGRRRRVNCQATCRCHAKNFLHT